MKKNLTREQAQTSKDRAARFVRNVLDDPDRADDIEDESLDDWADRKKITLTNPRPKRRVCQLIHEKGTTTMAKKNPSPSKQDLQDRIDELEQDNDNLQDALDQIADLAAGDDDGGDDGDDDGDDDQDDDLSN